jgi:hypothetical protein
MAAAGITGGPAMPKGLRHSFGVNAFQSSVPLKNRTAPTYLLIVMISCRCPLVHR